MPSSEGPIWAHLVSLGSIWSHLVPLLPIWSHLGRAHLVPFGPLLPILGPYDTIFSNMLKNSKLSSNIETIKKIFKDAYLEKKPIEGVIHFAGLNAVGE